MPIRAELDGMKKAARRGATGPGGSKVDHASEPNDLHPPNITLGDEAETTASPATARGAQDPVAAQPGRPLSPRVPGPRGPARRSHGVGRSYGAALAGVRGRADDSGRRGPDFATPNLRLLPGALDSQASCARPCRPGGCTAMPAPRRKASETRCAVAAGRTGGRGPCRAPQRHLGYLHRVCVTRPKLDHARMATDQRQSPPTGTDPTTLRTTSTPQRAGKLWL